MREVFKHFQFSASSSSEHHVSYLKPLIVTLALPCKIDCTSSDLSNHGIRPSGFVVVVSATPVDGPGGTPPPPEIDGVSRSELRWLKYSSPEL